MSCAFSDFEGLCELFNPNIEQNGCDENGNCICEEDPDPSIMCEDYQSIDDDWNED